jgi:hypothetical protein
VSVSRRAPVAAVAALAVAALVAHTLAFARLQGPLLIDDAYISFQYARRLAEGEGLVFNPGERVEGYTNFAWVVLMAAAAEAGLELPVVARAANVALGVVLTSCALAFLARRAARPAAAVLLAGGWLAADGSLARWSQDGMETVLFALAVFAGAAATARAIERGSGAAAPALAFALATLVRPEALLLFAAATGWRWLVDRRRPGALRDALTSVVIYGAAVLPHLAWRWTYYGDLLPNTFYAKVGGGGGDAASGALYVGRFFVEQRWAFLLFAVASCLLARRPRLARWQALFYVVGAVHLLYVVLVGGDWMGPGRFAVPVLAPIYLATAELAAGALMPRAGSPARRAAAALGAATVLAAHAVATARVEASFVRRERAIAESRMAVARWLRANAAPGDTLLTNEIGQLAWVSRLRTDDVYGLTDRHIARLERASDAGKPGHQKYDLEYSLSRRPTWIVVPGLGADLASWQRRVPAFSQYRAVVVPEPLPRPDYSVVLRRVEAAR